MRHLRVHVGALALLAISATPSTAQMCRGIPSTVHVMVEREKTAVSSAIYKAEVGVGPDNGGLLVDYSRGGGGGAEGSKSLAYSARVYNQIGEGSMSACFLFGYSGRKSYLVNPGGTNENLRIRSKTLIFAGALAAHGDVGPGDVALFVVPTWTVDYRELEAYDRHEPGPLEETTLEDSSYPFIWTVGTSVALGQIFGRVTWTKHPGRDGVLSLGAGLAW